MRSLKHELAGEWMAAVMEDVRIGLIGRPSTELRSSPALTAHRALRRSPRPQRVWSCAPNKAHAAPFAPSTARPRPESGSTSSKTTAFGLTCSDWARWSPKNREFKSTKPASQKPCRPGSKALRLVLRARLDERGFIAVADTVGYVQADDLRATSRQRVRNGWRRCRLGSTRWPSSTLDARLRDGSNSRVSETA